MMIFNVIILGRQQKHVSCPASFQFQTVMSAVVTCFSGYVRRGGAWGEEGVVGQGWLDEGEGTYTPPDYFCDLNQNRSREKKNVSFAKPWLGNPGNFLSQTAYSNQNLKYCIGVYQKSYTDHIFTRKKAQNLGKRTDVLAQTNLGKHSLFVWLYVLV